MPVELLDLSLNEDGLLGLEELGEPLALSLNEEGLLPLLELPDRSVSDDELLLLTVLPELSVNVNEELEGLEGLTDRSKVKLIELLGLPPPGISLGPAAKTCDERGSTTSAIMTAKPAATSMRTLR